MATDVRQHPLTVDLTGLPEPVVQQVRKLVHEAREKQADAAHGSNGAFATEAFPMFISDPNPSPEESRRLLDQMAARGMGTAPPLPSDWSRADLYEDHD